MINAAPATWPARRRLEAIDSSRIAPRSSVVLDA
jgi:hypothetical protein